MTECLEEPKERVKEVPHHGPPKKHIFIINGYGGCGKDSFIDFVAQYANVTRVSIIDFTKEIAKDIGWEGGKTEKDRAFLAELKDLIDNYNDENYGLVEWVTGEFLRDEKSEVLFVTMREKDQILRYADEYRAKKIFIQNDNIKKITSNHADAGVEDPEIQYDIIVDNNGTLDDLFTTALIFVGKYILGD